MDSVRRLAAMEPADLPEFHLDPFQEAVLANLYLEFFLAHCRALVTPRTTVITTGPAEPGETDDLAAVISSRRATVARWRRQVVVNLALYTALLETNSYYLVSNEHLLISRFVAVPGHDDEYVVKLYTIARRDLPERYNDKIYLGRDHISMRSFRRDHFGIPNIRRSVEEQIGKLKVRLARLVREDETELFNREYLADLDETVGELGSRVDELVRAFPSRVFTATPDTTVLLEASSRFRGVKHLLIEIEDSLADMEQTLLAEGHPRGARYVTKVRKDVTNYINFIMCKVNGRIATVVNRIDALAYFQGAAGVGR